MILGECDHTAVPGENWKEAHAQLCDHSKMTTVGSKNKSVPRSQAVFSHRYPNQNLQLLL